MERLGKEMKQSTQEAQPKKIETKKEDIPWTSDKEKLSNNPFIKQQISSAKNLPNVIDAPSNLLRNFLDSLANIEL